MNGTPSWRRSICPPPSPISARPPSTNAVSWRASSFPKACDCWNLEKITCPASLRVIGPRAFQGCINLYQIRLNKGLEAIGKDAFDDCESLETILIPHGTLDYFLALIPKPYHELIEEL